MIPLALAIAGLVAGAILVVAYAVRLGRRGTSQAVANVASYGYGPSVPLTTERQAKRTDTNLRLEHSLARIARRLSPADYESTLRIRLLQAGMYGLSASARKSSTARTLGSRPRREVKTRWTMPRRPVHSGRI